MALSLLAGAWVAAGLPPVLLAVVMGLMVFPLWAGAALALAILGTWWHRYRPRRAAVDEVRFFGVINAELNAGASVRMALEAACRSVDDPILKLVGRRVTDGAPISELRGGLRQALPINGRHAAFVLGVATETGGSASKTFAKLALRASRAYELDRERRSLTAQARLSAVVVAAVPIVALALLFSSGHAGVLLDSGSAGLIVVAVGLSLIGAGLGALLVMMRGGPR